MPPSEPGQQVFDRILSQLRTGAPYLFSSRRTLPGFLLLYTSIDIIASLTRPVNAASTTGAFYKDWVNDYMLPDSNLDITAEEMWGARCGLLHTGTAESNLSRRQGARMINYIGTTEAADEMQTRNDPTRTRDLFVSTPRFVEAFVAGCDRFKAKVQSDRALRHRVFFHAQNLMVPVD
jgi:hypothetical protein